MSSSWLVAVVVYSLIVGMHIIPFSKYCKEELDETNSLAIKALLIVSYVGLTIASPIISAFAAICVYCDEVLNK